MKIGSKIRAVALVGLLGVMPLTATVAQMTPQAEQTPDAGLTAQSGPAPEAQKLTKLNYKRSNGVTKTGSSERMRATTASGPSSSYLKFKMPKKKTGFNKINNLQATFNSTAPGTPCTPTTPRFVIITTGGSITGQLSPVRQNDCSATQTVELVNPGSQILNFDVSAITGNSQLVTYAQAKQIVAPFKVKNISLYVSVPENTPPGEYAWIVKPKVVVKEHVNNHRH
ncbi:MAG TPA: hypothetical protein VFX03_11485 [Thermomicrobiales bacterium]|nr:hypothetical protein [Thermomicrobiales bacterium]